MPKASRKTEVATIQEVRERLGTLGPRAQGKFDVSGGKSLYEKGLTTKSAVVFRIQRRADLTHL
jgi:hypothetical protein